MNKLLSLFCFLSIGLVVAQEQPLPPNGLLDVCFDSKYHKSQPGPESSLFNQCTPWKDNACCTENTTRGIHGLNSLFNFNRSHCKTMSQKCQNNFIQDHCFYECSPNVGPWIVKENRSLWRKETYFGVPICAADCNRWFDDCKDDYTCTDNWSKNFVWRKGTCDGIRECTTNFCPVRSKCLTFQQVYSDAKTFCETVFDGSWKYTENGPCMKIWFEGPNPNGKVVVLKVNSMSVGSKTQCTLITAVMLMVLTVMEVS